jgi:glycogenin glucosyltransferase
LIQGSFDGGDQGLLNDYFTDWERLSFTYNVTPSAFYSYIPAFEAKKDQIKVVHFIGDWKPWKWPRNEVGFVLDRPGVGNTLKGMVEMWWSIHDEHVEYWVSERCVGLIGCRSRM